MAILTITDHNGNELHRETIATGSAMNARRVTKRAATIAAGNIVSVELSGGRIESRRIVKVGRNYYTRTV